MLDRKRVLFSVTGCPSCRWDNDCQFLLEVREEDFVSSETITWWHHWKRSWFDFTNVVIPHYHFGTVQFAVFPRDNVHACSLQVSFRAGNCSCGRSLILNALSGTEGVTIDAASYLYVCRDEAQLPASIWHVRCTPLINCAELGFATTLC